MTMKRCFVLFIIILLGNSIIAQTVYSDKYIPDVEGVSVFSKLNRSEVVAKFGEPISYSSRVCEDTGTDEMYNYQNCFFYFNNGELNSFGLFGNCNYVVLKGKIGEGIKIGDSLSSLSTFEYGPPRRAEWITQDNQYYLDIGLDAYLYLSVEGDTIKGISYTSPW